MLWVAERRSKAGRRQVESRKHPLPRLAPGPSGQRMASATDDPGEAMDVDEATKARRAARFARKTEWSPALPAPPSTARPTLAGARLPDAGALLAPVPPQGDNPDDGADAGLTPVADEGEEGGALSCRPQRGPRRSLAPRADACAPSVRPQGTTGPRAPRRGATGMGRRTRRCSSASSPGGRAA